MMMVLRLLLALTGILFLFLDFRAYVRQKLTDSMGILWAFVSIVLILTGVVAFPEKHEYNDIVFLVFLVCLLLLLLLFKVSKTVSVLVMKNQELAMQVSLLNQENERILHKLGILSDEKEDTDRH